MTTEKIKVYMVSCEQTDLSNQVADMGSVMELIEGDIENVPPQELEGLKYSITIELMTTEQYNNLPESE